MQYRKPQCERPKLLVLHAGNRKISNSLQLWEMTEQHLQDFEIRRISLRNGFIRDCRGCAYDVCHHFGEEGSCFYGGPIAEEVYPAILDCDGLVMICPNYNDALSANLDDSAFYYAPVLRQSIVRRDRFRLQRRRYRCRAADQRAQHE